jgi:signal transduction histidine kinase
LLLRPTIDGVEIVIRDDGPGIAPDVRAHLFDPFYSGRPAGRGLGLGLSKCWRIVTAHGGTIDVNSQVGRGAEFVIRLRVGVKG